MRRKSKLSYSPNTHVLGAYPYAHKNKLSFSGFLWENKRLLLSLPALCRKKQGGKLIKLNEIQHR